MQRGWDSNGLFWETLKLSTKKNKKKKTSNAGSADLRSKKSNGGLSMQNMWRNMWVSKKGDLRGRAGIYPHQWDTQVDWWWMWGAWRDGREEESKGRAVRRKNNIYVKSLKGYLVVHVKGCTNEQEKRPRGEGSLRF